MITDHSVPQIYIKILRVSSRPNIIRVQPKHNSIGKDIYFLPRVHRFESSPPQKRRKLKETKRDSSKLASNFHSILL